MPKSLTLCVVTAAFVISTVSPNVRALFRLLESARQPGLPRFVSLRADVANVRVGPSTVHSVAWTFVRAAIPLEITQTYGNWRRIRDWQGAEGWIHRALLSNERTGLVAPWKDTHDHVLLRTQAADSAPVSAYLQPGLLVRPIMCTGLWCQVEIPKNDVEGYIHQERVWGVYPGEIVQ
jgi:SH3-like domain-containing protein